MKISASRLNITLMFVLLFGIVGTMLPAGLSSFDARTVVPAAESTPPARHIESNPKKDKNMKMTASQTKLYPVAQSAWGGQSVSFVVEKEKVKIEYDCADGEIPNALKIDKKGNFKMDGTHTRHSGGPIRRDNLPVPEPVRYEGKITGKVMNFKVTSIKTKDVIGEFTIERGAEPILTRCY